MRCGKPVSFSPPFFSASSARLAFLALAILACGTTPLPSQGSKASLTKQTQESPSLKADGNPLSPLLSEQMSDLQKLQEYQQQREQLYQQSLKDNSELKDLLRSSGETISNLRTDLENSTEAARQMGERLRTADQRNAELEAEKLRLEKKIARKNTAIAVLSGIIALFVVAALAWIYLKLKKIF